MQTFMSRLSAFLMPQIVGVPTLPNAIEMNGGIPNSGALLALMQSLQQNSAPFTGYCNYKSVSAASNFTFSATVLPGGMPGAVVLASGGAGVNGTTPTTDLLLASFGPNPFVGQTAMFTLANANTGTVTMVAGDANTTLAGTTTTLTVALRMFQIKVTNVPVPGAPGAASTNTTTTTAAVAAGVPSTSTTTTVIPVTASTGMTTAGSVLQVTNTDGTTFIAPVTTISSLNITVSGVNTKAVASGATVLVWNPTATVTGMFALDKTTGVYA